MIHRVGYPSETNYISDDTFKLRENAQQLLWRAIEDFPCGAANQILDILATNGEGTIRHQMLYADEQAQQLLEGFKPDDLDDIVPEDIEKKADVLTDNGKLEAILGYAQYVFMHGGPKCDDITAYSTALAVCAGMSDSTVSNHRRAVAHIGSSLIEKGISYEVFKQHLLAYDPDKASTYTPGENHAHDLRDSAGDALPIRGAIDYAMERFRGEAATA
jgi:hypothetical protein